MPVPEFVFSNKAGYPSLKLEPETGQAKEIMLDTDGEIAVGTERISNNNKVNTYTSAQTLDETHQFVLLDTSNGSIVITLPSASDIKGKVYNIKKIATNGTVILNTVNSQTIDGVASIKFAGRFSSVNIISDGSNWWVV